jgi:peptide deformylase
MPIKLPIIKEKTSPSLRETQTFIDNLLYTCSIKGLTGLAAPEVGVPLRILVMIKGKDEQYPDSHRVNRDRCLVFINPEIISCSSESLEDWESCPCIPDTYAVVGRPVLVQVKFTNREGRNEMTTLDSAQLAAVFMMDTITLKES